MRRRISPARVRVPRRFLPWLLTANLLAGLLLGGWYLAQPEPRQREVGRLVANAFERDKQVSFLEVAWDVWQLYYAGGAGAGKIAAGDKTLIYGGAPRALTESAANRVLVNRGYAVGYSDARANPLWAAYRMQDLARIPEAPKRPERFETDRRTAARVGPEAYSGSGYDRGHLAPNYGIATRYGAAAQKETFLMSNIAPQRHALNAGLWQDLERRIATNWPARYGEVWVLTGPVFGTQPAKLKGGVEVPEAFFKIVIDENEGRLRTLAFLVPQETPATADPARFLTTIGEIQRRTGLDFLAELEDAAEQAVEAARAEKVW